TTFNAGLSVSAAMTVAIMATQIPQSTLNTVLGGRSSLGPADADTLFSGFQLVFLSGVVFTLLGFITVLFHHQASPEAKEQPRPALQPEMSSSDP
ncbi:MAG TPA: hypothetical protein VNL15_03385, partial [Dehalococcoidia bacterium]|nr:hypothetical protein [Dehalococcoidia bacterium]